jgi:rod shape-determining protein MreC
MESFFARHKNATILAVVLVAQLLGLATQIKRPTESGPVRLIRQWAVALVTPFERGLVHSEQGIRHAWRDYFYLRGVRHENVELREQIEAMRLEQIRLEQDAAQARRIQALLQFKEQYISKTVAAQVIGSSGSETSRIIYIDRGSNQGIESNMAVITPEGIVGKVLRVYPSTSQVLEITDQTSGVGATLVKSRLQGILKGQPEGNPNLAYIMADESVVPGEDVVTSGGDRIFPKGLPVGKVVSVSPGKDLFLNVRVTPSASLGRLEEVLVITKVTEKEADTTGLGPIRASDILAQRLPSVPDKPAGTTPNSAPGGTSQAASSTAATAPAANTPGAAAAPGNGAAAKPKTTQPRPAKSTVETAKPAAGGEATP